MSLRIFSTIGYLGEGGWGVGLSVHTPAASDSHLNADEQLLTSEPTKGKRGGGGRGGGGLEYEARDIVFEKNLISKMSIFWKLKLKYTEEKSLS